MWIGRWGITKRKTRGKNMVSIMFLLLFLHSETRSLLAPRGQSVWSSEAWLWAAAGEV